MGYLGVAAELYMVIAIRNSWDVLTLLAFPKLGPGDPKGFTFWDLP
jgi:hypothetical protein